MPRRLAVASLDRSAIASAPFGTHLLGAMTTIVLVALALLPLDLRASDAPAARAAAARSVCPALLQHSFTPIQGGEAQSLCQYSGKVVLAVNTASQCG